MATRTSVGSGLWSAAGTWDTGVPVDNDTVIIAAGHSVEFDVDMSNAGTWPNGIAGLTITSHATTPAMLYVKDGADAQTYLKIKTATTIAGTNAAAKGRLLANSDGVWGNTGTLEFARKFIIDLGVAGYINAEYLDIALRCTEPAHPYVEIYGTLAETVTGDAANDRLNSASTGFANTNPVMFRVSGGSLPTPLTVGDVYYVVNKQTHTFQVALTSGGTAVELTTNGSGTITAYNGSGTVLADTDFHVLQDVSADAQWFANARCVLVDVNQPGDSDQQRTSLNAVTDASHLSINDAIDSEQYPLARLWLMDRNVSIRSACTTGIGIVSYPTAATHGGVFGCEIRSSAGTGTTFNGIGVYYGTGHTISGTVSGCNYGVYAGTGHTISGTVSGCSIGVSYGTGHTISGTVSGCSIGVSYGTGHTISGTVSGCNSGVYAGTGHTISGTVSGCGTGVYYGTGHTISGTVSGCSIGVSYGTGHTISGTVSGCNSGVYAGTGHTISGTVSGCSYGYYDGYGHTLSGAVTGCSYVCRIEYGQRLLSRGAALPTPPTFMDRGSTSLGYAPYQGLLCEDYGGVLGAHRAFWINGDVIRNAATTRGGGAATSLEVVPLSSCSKARFIPIFEWTEHDVPASAQTRGVYVLGNGWTSFPTAAQLWFEAEYLDSASLVTRTIIKSTAVLTDNVTWTKLGVNFTPGQAGIVRYKAFLATYESGASVFVDNLLVTS